MGRNSDSLRAGRSRGRIPVADIFRTLADRPLGPLNLLYSGYREWPLWNPTVHRQRTLSLVTLIYSTRSHHTFLRSNLMLFCHSHLGHPCSFFHSNPC